MLMPKRVKYRKLQKGRMGGKATRGSSIAFGEYGFVGGLRQFVTLEIERATGSKVELLFRKADGEMFVKTVEDFVNIGNRD